VPPAPTSASEPDPSQSTALLRSSARRYVRRAAAAGAWIRFFSGRSDYAMLARSIRALVPKRSQRSTATNAGGKGVEKIAPDALERPGDGGLPIHAPTWDSLVRARANGASVTLVWGELDGARHMFDDVLLARVPELGSLFATRVIDGGTHECAETDAFEHLA